MPRKRKSLASDAPQEPEPVQPNEPEPEPQEPGAEPEETLDEDPVVGEDVVEDKGEEEDNQDGEGEEEQTDNMEAEHQDDAVCANPDKIEQESGLNEKPSENAVSENGGEAEGQKEEVEEELEEEPLEKLLEPFSKDQLTLLMKEAVAKHPDVVENVHKLADADPAHRKIFVFGLGWEATAETVTSVFGKYGEIEDCKVVKDKNSGKSKGYGFIMFKHRKGARRALKQPQKTIDGRTTSCQLASAGPVQTPAATTTATVSSPPASEYTQRKIYVSNVSAEVDTKKLVEFFSKFGEIEEGPLGLDKQTGKPRGFCLFVYKSFESAKKALEEPHRDFEGQMLHCQKAVDGPKHSKGYFNQQHSQPQPQHRQGYHHHAAKKGRYGGSSRGAGQTGGHMMAPSAGPAVPSAGFNPAVAPAALGQAVAALLANQGSDMGIRNLYGGGMNPQGIPPMMNNAGYGGQGAIGYGGQPGMQGFYGSQPQIGQGGVRPHQGGAPYMGRGH